MGIDAVHKDWQKEGLFVSMRPISDLCHGRTGVINRYGKWCWKLVFAERRRNTSGVIVSCLYYDTHASMRNVTNCQVLDLHSMHDMASCKSHVDVALTVVAFHSLYLPRQQCQVIRMFHSGLGGYERTTAGRGQMVIRHFYSQCALTLSSANEGDARGVSYADLLPHDGYC